MDPEIYVSQEDLNFGHLRPEMRLFLAVRRWSGIRDLVLYRICWEDFNIKVKLSPKPITGPPPPPPPPPPKKKKKEKNTKQNKKDMWYSWKERMGGAQGCSENADSHVPGRGFDLELAFHVCRRGRHSPLHGRGRVMIGKFAKQELAECWGFRRRIVQVGLPFRISVQAFISLEPCC